MSMSISEAAIYLNESEDNIRLMLMNAYPETFDTLTELSDEQVQLIEQVKGQATLQLHQLAAAAPTQEDSHSNAHSSNGELTVKEDITPPEMADAYNQVEDSAQLGSVQEDERVNHFVDSLSSIFDEEDE